MTVPVKDMIASRRVLSPYWNQGVGVVALELLPDDVANHLVVFVRFVGFQFFQRTLAAGFLLGPEEVFIQAGSCRGYRSISFVFKVHAAG